MTLEAAFFDRPVPEVAPDLIGCVVVHGPTSGTIVEVEAYHHSEPARHAYGGVPPRTSTLPAPPGGASVDPPPGPPARLHAGCPREGVGPARRRRAAAP